MYCIVVGECLFVSLIGGGGGNISCLAKVDPT